jgi:hypothetical protein
LQLFQFLRKNLYFYYKIEKGSLVFGQTAVGVHCGRPILRIIQKK